MRNRRKSDHAISETAVSLLRKYTTFFREYIGTVLFGSRMKPVVVCMSYTTTPPCVPQILPQSPLHNVLFSARVTAERLGRKSFNPNSV